MQLNVEQAVGKFPQVAYVFSKTGTAEVASDPMPPNSSDTFVILKPKEEWPDPSLSKAELQEQIEEAVGKLAGNVFEFSQPIQLRFNELLAGTRGDLAVKVFGDEFEPMTQAANQVAAILRGIAGAEDVKVEQTSGLPFLEIRINKSEAARYGLSTGIIQDVIGTAIGGRDAGVVFEGDRRFPDRRAPDRHESARTARRWRICRCRWRRARTDGPPSVLLKQVASFQVTRGAEPDQPRKRQATGRGHRQRAGARHRLVRGGGAGEDRPQQVKLPTGYYVDLGRPVREPASATAAADDRGTGLLLGDLRPAVLGPRIAAGCRSRLQRRAAGAHRRYSGPVAAGHAVLSVRGRRLHRALRRRGAQRPGHADLRQAARCRGPAQAGGHLRRRDDRLRPVVMTALVASLGFVPMALATGTGAEVQRPLATVVIGGLISATLLTLLVLPALYDRFGKADRKGIERRSEISPRHLKAAE